MTPSILFDLGNTLVSYYEREEFPGVLAASLRAARAALVAEGIPAPPLAEVTERAGREGQDPADLSTRPLAQRLESLFGAGATEAGRAALRRAAREFVGPMHAPAAVYPDTIPALERLAAAGYRIGIVSNLPWGVPSELWRDELARHGIEPHLEFAIFCSDVGYRKPAPQIFRAAIDRLGVAPRETLFVGDEPVWDVEGAERAGIPAVLMDRRNRHAGHPGPRVRSLAELLDRLELL